MWTFNSRKMDPRKASVHEKYDSYKALVTIPLTYLYQRWRHFLPSERITGWLSLPWKWRLASCGRVDSSRGHSYGLRPTETPFSGHSRGPCVSRKRWALARYTPHLKIRSWHQRDGCHPRPWNGANGHDVGLARLRHVVLPGRPVVWQT